MQLRQIVQHKPSSPSLAITYRYITHHASQLAPRMAFETKANFPGICYTLAVCPSQRCTKLTRYSLTVCHWRPAATCHHSPFELTSQICKIDRQNTHRSGVPMGLDAAKIVDSDSEFGKWSVLCSVCKHWLLSLGNRSAMYICTYRWDVAHTRWLQPMTQAQQTRMDDAGICIFWMRVNITELDLYCYWPFGRRVERDRCPWRLLLFISHPFWPELWTFLPIYRWRRTIIRPTGCIRQHIHEENQSTVNYSVPIYLPFLRK